MCAEGKAYGEHRSADESHGHHVPLAGGVQLWDNCGANDAKYGIAHQANPPAIVALCETLTMQWHLPLVTTQGKAARGNTY